MSDGNLVAQSISNILKSYNLDIKSDGLKETPQRVSRMYDELLSGYDRNPKEIFKTFENDSYSGLVMVADIQFYSLCEHHMVPFHGKAHIGYVPNGKILGLSKFARLVNIFSRRLQVQERLTEQVAQAISDNLHPKGVIVYMEAEHLCMSMRGVNKPGATTKTLSIKGFEHEKQLYVDQFMSQIRK